MPLNLYDRRDQHKYLTAGERQAFHPAALGIGVQHIHADGNLESPDEAIYRLASSEENHIILPTAVLFRSSIKKNCGNIEIEQLP
jgi:hypothetical protein